MNQSAMAGKVVCGMLVGTMLTCGGCSWFGGGGGAGEPRQVSSNSFTSAQPVNPNPPEASFSPQVQVDMYQPQPRIQVLGGGEKLVPAPSVNHVDPAVVSSVQSPSDGATTRPGGAATQAFGEGTYLTVGGVVARVNGQAITANRVLKSIALPLAAKARELDEAKYRVAARDLIRGQIDQFIKAQVVYAAADRALDDNEKNLADNLTAKWRQDQITNAGGSLQLAMQAAEAARGMTFEELTQEQHETDFARVYFQKRLVPRIQVTTQDMREYYQRNVEKLFTDKASVSFRLIKIDPKNLGGMPQAQQRMEEIRQRLAKGESFESLATGMNHDPYLAKKGGLVGPIEKGSYGLEKVEAAAWKTPAGQLTDTVEDKGAIYLVQVESVQQDRVRPFTDEAVQEQITNQLRGEQFNRLRYDYERKLQDEAIVTRDPAAESIAVDIAMQAYHIWHTPANKDSTTPVASSPVSPAAPATPVAPATPDLPAANK